MRKIYNKELKRIGYVSVDSGQMCITDPCHGWIQENRHLGVKFDTGVGDGRFGVYSVGDNEGVLIDLDGIVDFDLYKCEVEDGV